MTPFLIPEVNQQTAQRSVGLPNGGRTQDLNPDTGNPGYVAKHLSAMERSVKALITVMSFLFLTLSSVRGDTLESSRRIDNCSAAGLKAVMRSDQEFPLRLEIRDLESSEVYYELHRRYSPGDRLLYEEISQIEPARLRAGCFIADPLPRDFPYFCSTGNNMHVDQGDDLTISRALLRRSSLQLAITSTYHQFTGPEVQTWAEQYYVKLDDGAPIFGLIFPKQVEMGIAFEHIEPGVHKVLVGVEYSIAELFPTDAICFEVSSR